MTASLAGSGVLLRQGTRHDLPRFWPWALALVLLCGASVAAYPAAFPHDVDREGLAAAIGANPAISVLFGHPQTLLTAEGFTAWRSLAMGGPLMGLDSGLSIIRATRKREEAGLSELIGSGRVGRLSELASAATVAFLGSLLVGGITGVATALCGGEWAPSLLLGADFAAAGLVFGAVGAVTAQLATESHGATLLLGCVLAATFLLRGVLDAVNAPGWTTWLTPQGWIARTRPAGEDAWWPLLPALVLTGALIAVAFWLRGRRDLGAGIIAPRPGRAVGRLRGPFGLAWRLERSSAIAWLLAAAALGVIFAGLATSFQDLIGSNEQVRAIMAAGATAEAVAAREFIRTILEIVGLISAVAAVQGILRLRQEETTGRLENLLSAPLSRPRYLASVVVPALAISAAMVALAGGIVAVVAGAAGLGVDTGEILAQAALTIPAAWVTASLALTVVGWLPRLAGLAWIGVAVAFVLTMLGRLMNLPEGVLKLSPFAHVPTVNGALPDLWPLVATMGVGVALAALGFLGFRRGDVPA